MNRKKSAKKILIADDDTSILEATKLILEDAGYNVYTTTNGDTVARIYEQKPNIVLLDIWMSGIDGRNICKHLKSQDATKSLPIIIVSANKDIEKIAKKAGADDFLTKPFDMYDLLKKIEKYLKT